MGTGKLSRIELRYPGQGIVRVGGRDEAPYFLKGCVTSVSHVSSDKAGSPRFPFLRQSFSFDLIQSFAGGDSLFTMSVVSSNMR